MYLMLEVVSPQAASVGARPRHVVGVNGLTIGRAPDNDWVIPDPYVSKQHARIVCAQGRFFIEGLGRNPIALGSANNAIPAHQPQPLDNGDRLFIDQYEILVKALAGDPPGGEAAQIGNEAVPENVDVASDADAPAGPPVELVRDIWDVAVGDVVEFDPPEQAVAEKPPQTSPADLAALLRAAGLPEHDVSPQVVQELGKVLRVVVHGVMDVLQGRAEIKSQFRLPATRVQARENNPLKLSPNVESALHTLLVRRDPGYLPTVQAFEDAFADIRHHQLAMLEGLRVAFENMLGAFDPQVLEQDFERTVKRTGLLGGLAGKSRYWELYAQRFAHLGRDADETFRRLFGDVFAEAYERQLEQLKKQQK